MVSVMPYGLLLRHGDVRRGGDDTIPRCLAEDHHEHDQHGSSDPVELGLGVERRGDRIETVSHHTDTRLVNVAHRGVAELRDQIAIDLALVRADGSNRALLFASVRLRANCSYPAVGVLCESDRSRPLCISFRSATVRHRRRRFPRLAGNPAVCARQPGTGIGLREECQRLVIIGAGCVNLTVRGRIPGLPATGWELPKAPPSFTPLYRGRSRRRCAHHALQWPRADTRGRSCHFVPLRVNEIETSLLTRDSF